MNSLTLLTEEEAEVASSLGEEEKGEVEEEAEVEETTPSKKRIKTVRPLENTQLRTFLSTKAEATNEMIKEMIEEGPREVAKISTTATVNGQRSRRKRPE